MAELNAEQRAVLDELERRRASLSPDKIAILDELKRRAAPQPSKGIADKARANLAAIKAGKDDDLVNPSFVDQKLAEVSDFATRSVGALGEGLGFVGDLLTPELLRVRRDEETGELSNTMPLSSAAREKARELKDAGRRITGTERVINPAGEFAANVAGELVTPIEAFQAVRGGTKLLQLLKGAGAPKEIAEQATKGADEVVEQVAHQADEIAPAALADAVEAAPKAARPPADAIAEAEKIATEAGLDTAVNDAPQKAQAFGSFRENLHESMIATREHIQDDWIRVKKLVEDPNVKISEVSDPYLAETLFHGRVATRVEEAKETLAAIDADMVAVAKATDLPPEAIANDVNRFLHARHTPERNAQLGENAAGMTDQEAAEILREIEASPHGGKVTEIADRLQQMNDQTLDVLLEGEVIDQGLYETLRERYPHHIPLNRIMDETEDIGSALSGRPLDVRSSGIQRAKGSEREVADVVTNIAAAHEQAIIRAEKNRVDLATLAFARQNPELELFAEIKPRAIGQTFDEKIITERISDPQVLTLREKGKPVHLRINDPHLAAAFRGVNRQKVDGLLRVVGSVTRFYSGLATRFNPEFAIPNKLRDLQESVVFMASKAEFSSASVVKTVARDPQSMKAVADGLRRIDSEGARLYHQMKRDGGTTGGLGLSTRKAVELDLDKIRVMNRSEPRKAAEELLRFVDGWNTLFEDSTRLSVYRAALENGASRSRAAQLAKEASINFNKFGTGGPIINALWMFSNASIQGSTKLLRAMKNPKVAGGVIASVSIANAAVTEWNERIDPDWREKVTPWDRMSALPVMLPSEDGKTRYIAIPVSWGLKPIKVASDYALDAAYSKGGGVADAASGVTAAIVEGYNPAGGTDLTSAITPTILDLPVELARNRAWHGGRIRPDWDRNAPASIQYFDELRESSTGKTFIVATKGLSGVGIEVSPADVDYAYKSLIGGAGRSTSKVVNSIAAISSGEVPDPREIPFASRFLRMRESDQYTDSKEVDRLRFLLAQQSRERFMLKQQAEDSWAQIRALPPEDGAKILDRLSETDPELAEKVMEAREDEAMGLNYGDRLVRQLGVRNGARAKYLRVQIMSLPEDQREAYIEEMKQKKLISREVGKQLGLEGS